MNYNFFLCTLMLLFINNCTVDTLNKSNIKYDINDKFSNKGFTLLYSDQLLEDKFISKKLDQRSLLIFQKNLKKGTSVKITNIINNKSLVAKVAGNAAYPLFNNSVITSRIAHELNLNINEPYIEIVAISENSMFVAKRSKTYDEEKKIADKAPVDSIIVNDINIKKLKIDNVEIKKKFSYSIKVADFYFKETAKSMMERIKNETNINKSKIQKLSSNKYRVYLGPFDDITSLQISFNDISILKFENIEIIKND